MLRTVLFALLIAANITSMSAMQKKKPSPLELLPADCMGEVLRFYIGSCPDKKDDQNVLVNPYKDFLLLALTSKDILNFMTEVLKRNPNLKGMLKEIRINKIKNIPYKIIFLAIKLMESQIDTEQELCNFLKRRKANIIQVLIPLYTILPSKIALKKTMKFYIKNVLNKFLDLLVKMKEGPKKDHLLNLLQEAYKQAEMCNKKIESHLLTWYIKNPTYNIIGKINDTSQMFHTPTNDDLETIKIFNEKTAELVKETDQLLDQKKCILL